MLGLVQRHRFLLWTILSTLVLPCALMLVLRSWLALIVMAHVLVVFAAVLWECRPLEGSPVSPAPSRATRQHE
jgi:hypothetical protein